MVIVAAAVALGLTALLGRVMGLPPRLAVLIGIGTAICGNSAIAATAPVIDADETEVSFAVGTITVFGMAAFLLYPLIGHTLGMGEHLFGYWAGAAVNDTSQATATGFAFSQTAGGIATVVQLTRNTLLGPVLLVIGAMYARRTSRVPQPSSGRAPRLLTIVPAFVLGFVVLALVNSVGGIPLAAQSPIAFGANGHTHRPSRCRPSDERKGGAPRRTTTSICRPCICGRDEPHRHSPHCPCHRDPPLGQAVTPRAVRFIEDWH